MVRALSHSQAVEWGQTPQSQRDGVERDPPAGNLSPRAISLSACKVKDFLTHKKTHSLLLYVLFLYSFLL